MHSADPTEETMFSFSDKAPPPQENGGGYARRLTTLRVGTITIDGRRELCLIRNISAGGLRAHVYSPLDKGQKVAVELKTNQQTQGTVSWIQDNSVGIEFTTPIDVEELLAAQAGGDGAFTPRMPRVEVDRLGELRIGARIYPINTCDISQGGVQLEIDTPLRVGDAVVLTLEKWRPIQGVVRWYCEGKGGISFNQVIPFQELMGWLRGSKAA
ncbi:MAG TPA: PilZ domain-containing protein [Allosphingosinicella sp.]|uniref:PilZ domain-containing protein n=1 Tax=Allosphingosinicella sp. TaxID=2823234 RepID=UPI002ED96938